MEDVSKEAELERRFSRDVSLHQDVVFEFTRDPGLLHQYYKLREQMYAHIWELENFSGEEDEYDRQGMILIARKGKQVIAGARMLISSPRNRRSLSMEECGIDLRSLFPELRLENEVYCEFSRMVQLPEYCSRGFSVQIHRALKRKAIAHGVKYCFVLAPKVTTRNYRSINLIDKNEYVIRYDIPIPDDDDFEGISMVLSYFKFPDHFEGPDEYGIIHRAEDWAKDALKELATESE